MELEELKALIKENGIVGAGGAGFPTYMKIDKRANTILLNCAECEPLLKLHRQLLKEYAKEIIKTFSRMADCMDAQEAIICIKEDYHATIEAVNYYIKEYPKVTLKLLPSVYPMGDEVVLIYEATGKVVAPGGLPIESGIAVFNVETVYNVYITVDNFLPVTNKLLTIVGEVENPVTVRVPLGTSLREAVDMAGGEKKGIGTEELVYFVGGPMMGKIGSPYDVVTKPTNAILVLPSSHTIVQKKQIATSRNLKRAASA